MRMGPYRPLDLPEPVQSGASAHITDGFDSVTGIAILLAASDKRPHCLHTSSTVHTLTFPQRSKNQVRDGRLLTLRIPSSIAHKSSSKPSRMECTIVSIGRRRRSKQPSSNGTEDQRTMGARPFIVTPI